MDILIAYSISFSSVPNSSWTLSSFLVNSCQRISWRRVVFVMMRLAVTSFILARPLLNRTSLLPTQSPPKAAPGSLSAATMRRGSGSPLSLVESFFISSSVYSSSNIFSMSSFVEPVSAMFFATRTSYP